MTNSIGVGQSEFKLDVRQEVVRQPTERTAKNIYIAIYVGMGQSEIMLDIKREVI